MIALKYALVSCSHDSKSPRLWIMECQLNWCWEWRRSQRNSSGCPQRKRWASIPMTRRRKWGCRRVLTLRRRRFTTGGTTSGFIVTPLRSLCLTGLQILCCSGKSTAFFKKIVFFLFLTPRMKTKTEDWKMSTEQTRRSVLIPTRYGTIERNKSFVTANMNISCFYMYTLKTLSLGFFFFFQPICVLIY